MGLGLIAGNLNGILKEGCAIWECNKAFRKWHMLSFSRLFNSHHWASPSCGYGGHSDFEVQFQNGWQLTRDCVVSGKWGPSFIFAW